MRKTLVINAGSSSLKYMMFEMPEYKQIAEGIIERIGLEMGVVTLKFNEQKINREMPIENHEIGIKAMLDLFEEYKVIENYEEITKIGHRVVQGGEVFKSSALVGEKELEQIKDLAKLAPLHNMPNSVGIEVFSKLIPTAQNIACFDTTFHQTMPAESYMYPVPYQWYEDYSVRRYGMHGISHQFIAEKLPTLIGKEDLKFINCHLGNGASLTAIDNGKCLQTSMGLTPLAGIMMGTRCGDIDPSIINYIHEQTGASIAEITNDLNKKSGLLGLSGVSSDFRDITTAMEAGDERAKLAFDVYVTRVAEVIGAYFARLGRLDAIVFTAGIGENAKNVRAAICQAVAHFGIDIDLEKNDTFSDTVEISTPQSKVKVYIIPTEEEYMIAKEAEQF